MNPSDKIDRCSNPAIPVGMGVHRDRAKSKVKPVPTISLDEPAEWVDIPQVDNQMYLGPHMAKIDSFIVKIFNLDKEDEMKGYQEFLSKAYLPLSNVLVTHDEVRFHEATGTYKALVKAQVFKFRKIVDKDHPKPTL